MFDGTQPPPPPRLYPDPLAGLVTGESPHPGAPMGDPATAGFAMPEVGQVQVDEDAVRAMVEAAMADAPQIPPHAPPPPVFAGQGGPTPGMVPPPQRARPSGAHAWQALRTYPRQIRQQARQGMPVLPVKPSRNSTGIIIALVLLAVFGLIALQLIASVVDGLSSTFE